MVIPIFKRELVQDLYNSVEKNISHYIAGDFGDIFESVAIRSNIRYIKNTKLDAGAFGDLTCESGGDNDAKNALLVFTALDGLTPHLAADERVWVALTHTVGLKFSVGRWLKNPRDEQAAIRDVKLHLFCRTGNRSFHRNNALASLWWWAYAASRIDDGNLKDSLANFVGSPSFRADIIERPTLSRVEKVFKAIFICYRQKLEREPQTNFFTRSGRYREWLKLINLSGGRVLYGSMSEGDLALFFSELLSQVEKS